MMNSFSKPYVLDPSGTAGPQLNARNEPVVPLVEPRVAPMLDERGSRPTIVAQIPAPLGRQARPQQGTLPLPQVCPDLLADKKTTTRVSRISNFLSSETALSSSSVSINGNGGHWPVLHEGDERDDRPSSQVPTSSPTKYKIQNTKLTHKKTIRFSPPDGMRLKLLVDKKVSRKPPG